MKIADRIKIDNTVLRPDEQIPAHVQDTWELAYVTVGRGMRIIGDTTEPFAEGDVVLVPPGMSHQWVFDPSHTDDDGNIADTALFIEPALLDEMAVRIPDFTEKIKSITARTYAVEFKGDRQKTIQKLMLRLAETETPEMKVICFLSLLTLIGAGDEDKTVVGRQTCASTARRKADKVRIYCECNYMKRITLGDAARHTGMNVSSFCKFFLRNFGCSFTEYINRLRVNECRLRLKATADPVAEIAYHAGFSSVTYFNRVFLRQCGCSPSQYRAT